MGGRELSARVEGAHCRSMPTSKKRPRKRTSAQGRASRPMTLHLAAQAQALIEPIIEGMGFSLVDLVIDRCYNSATVVVYGQPGPSVGALAQISSNLKPRFELHEGLSQFGLIVTSPGSERVLRNNREFSLFRGKRVRLLRRSKREWESGVILDVDENSVSLGEYGCSMDEGVETIGFRDIEKAILDCAKEVEI